MLARNMKVEEDHSPDGGVRHNLTYFLNTPTASA